MKILTMLLVLLLIGCGSSGSSTDSDDLLHALKTWTESDISSYSFKIQFTSRGCEHAKLTVVQLVGQEPKTLRLDPSSKCQAAPENSPILFGKLSISQLFDQILLFYASENRGEAELYATFDKKLGYPTSVTWKTPGTNDAPPAEVGGYRVSDFEVWLEGK